MNKISVWNTGVMMRTRHTEVVGKNPIVMSFSPPQIANRIPLDQTRASASTGYRITISATTRALESRIWWVQ